MEKLEGEHASLFALNGALQRVGNPEEFDFFVSEKASYLTGTDILCDGGSIASMKQTLTKKVVEGINHDSRISND